MNKLFVLFFLNQRLIEKKNTSFVCQYLSFTFYSILIILNFSVIVLYAVYNVNIAFSDILHT